MILDTELKRRKLRHKGGSSRSVRRWGSARRLAELTALTAINSIMQVAPEQLPDPANGDWFAIV
jgi:hypothetical protein